MIEPIKRQRGFSLAEVLVAIALLSVILLALFGLITGGMQRAYSGKKMTQATNLAQTVLEQANATAPYSVLGAHEERTSATLAVVKTNTVTATFTSVGGDMTKVNTYPTTTTTGWSTLVANSDLPGTVTLTVTETPQPAGSFKNASLVRIVVDLDWTEWGKRHKQVRLQALNIRTTTPNYF